MAVYDGFFDAEYIDGPDGTGHYDREYNSSDFTAYFGQIVGTGVCVATDPDSCKVWLEEGKAYIHEGYLFIQGYWLRIKDEPYAIDLTGTGPMDIVAYLNTGKKMIELEARPTAETYPADMLVLGIVDPAAGTAEDTRYNWKLCGVIDSAGGLSGKAAFALEYIDREVDRRLKALESDIAAKNREVDQKIADADYELSRLTPAPVGTIKFSAAPNMGEEWLRCDGRTVSREDYPELVGMLLDVPGLDDGFDESEFYWTKELLPSTTNWQDIAYGNGRFIAVSSDKDVAAYSEDGKNWELLQVPFASYHVIYGKGIFVITGYGTDSAYSGDGKTWFKTSTPFEFISLAYGNGIFVGVASGGNAAYSNNGKTWTKVQIPNSGWTDVAYGNGIFVAVSKGTLSNAVSDIGAYSEDGRTWIQFTLPSPERWSSITYGDGRFCAVSGAFSVSNCVAYSKDVKQWSVSKMPSFANWDHLTYGGGLFVAVDRGDTYNNIKSNKSAYSKDCITWTDVTLPTAAFWMGMVYGSGKFVAITGIDHTNVAAYAAPFDNAKLPTLSLSNVPAYIKAKETGQ